MYPVHVFYYQRPFRLIAVATLNLKKKIFLNDSSSKITVSSVANFITAYEESQ